MSYSDGASTYDKLSDSRFTQALYGGHTWAHFTELKGAHLLTTTSCCRHTQTMARTFCIVTTIISRTAFSKAAILRCTCVLPGAIQNGGGFGNSFEIKTTGQQEEWALNEDGAQKKKKEVGWKEDRFVR